MKIIPKVTSFALRAATGYGHAAYGVASVVFRDRLKEMQRLHPQAFVPSPEVIEREASKRIPRALQRVIVHVAGAEVPIEKLERLVGEGLKIKLFVSYGEVVYINPFRVKQLLASLGRIEELRGRIIDEASFFREATERALLRSHAYSNQVAGSQQAEYRTIGGIEFRVRPYVVTARDARDLSLTGVIRTFAVRAGDDKPSVLMLNGIFCKKGSLKPFTTGLARSGNWAYQLDVRDMGDSARAGPRTEIFFDTYVSNDLPAAVDFIYHRPRGKQKPVVIVGHSMGGMMAKFMVIRQAYKLNLIVEEIARRSGVTPVTTVGHTRGEVEAFLNSSEVATAMGGDEEVAVLIAEAQGHLEILKAVKGIITLGSPMIFDKYANPFWPAVLMLNIALPTAGVEKVPLSIPKWVIKHLPVTANVLRPLINPANFDDPAGFLARFAVEGTDDGSLGVGLQFTKAIYAGQGFRRMGKTRFNYPEHLDVIPTDIPVFDIVGQQDFLCPPFNLGFIDRQYAAGTQLDLSHFPKYSHSSQRVHVVSADTDVAAIPLEQTPNQVTGFLVDGIGHLDCTEGKTAERQVRPLIERLIGAMG